MNIKGSESMEHAATEYSSDPVSREWFCKGWQCFLDGAEPAPSAMNAWQYKYAIDGYLEAGGNA